MVEQLQRPISKLLFLTAEMFEEKLIDSEQSQKLKQRIFMEDKNLISAMETTTDMQALKTGLISYSIRLVAQDKQMKAKLA